MTRRRPHGDSAPSGRAAVGAPASVGVTLDRVVPAEPVGDKLGVIEASPSAYDPALIGTMNMSP